MLKNADMSEEMQTDAIDCATQVRSGGLVLVLRERVVGRGDALRRVCV